VGCGDAEPVDAESAFTAWVNRKSDGQVTSTGAILKKGRDVMKTVQTRYFGHAPDGEPSRRELRFRTHTVRGRTEFDFDDNSADKTSWYCQNDEIDRLVVYLTESVDRTGRFRMVEANSPEVQLEDSVGGTYVGTWWIADHRAEADVRRVEGTLTIDDDAAST
jgi:hypothetical protein